MIDRFSVPEVLVGGFQHYIRQEAPKEFQGSAHVADYAYAWLVHDRGALACGNDHAVLLSVLLLCESDLSKGPSFFVEPGSSVAPPSKLIDTGCLLCCNVLDPQFFRLMATDPDAYYRESLGRRPRGRGRKRR